MATDVLPESPKQFGAQSKSESGQYPASSGGPAPSRWGPKHYLMLCVLAVISVGAAYLPTVIQSEEIGPKLTYRVSRGDLIVTVTEQGTLESSNNTEIKCKVRGFSTVTYVIPAGTVVEPCEVLVRLDTKVIDEQHSLTKTNTFIAQATLETTKANVA